VGRPVRVAVPEESGEQAAKLVEDEGSVAVLVVQGAVGGQVDRVVQHVLRQLEITAEVVQHEYDGLLSVRALASEALVEVSEYVHQGCGVDRAVEQALDAVTRALELCGE